MTTSGGANNYGCIFSIDTDGNGYKTLLDFDTINGAYPNGSLLISGSKLFGMTRAGGVYGDGTIFSLDKSGGEYKDLLDFNGVNGSAPRGSLIISGNRLYGMTYSGGANSYDGVIFSIDTDGSGYIDLHDFNGLNGSNPYGSLTLSGKTLFGMTAIGGSAYGDIFSIDTNGSGFKEILVFNGISNGEIPYGSLTIFGKVLYGMTYGGAKSSFVNGNIFSIDTNGSGFKNLYSLNGYSGANPSGSLIISDSLLFGMTFVYGANQGGTIFSIDTNGSGCKALYDFSFTTGSNPSGDLTLSGNMLYGMTENGGADSVGVIFSFNYTTVGIDELKVESEKLKVYPVPASNTVNIVFKHPVEAKLSIENILGETVYSENNKTYAKETAINISMLTSGIYILKIESENSTVYKRIMKM
jgi:uncharacterized repeat protein (TIGR03803 family)